MIDYRLEKWDFFFPRSLTDYRKQTRFKGVDLIQLTTTGQTVTFVKTVMIEGYIKGCQYLGDCQFDEDSAVSQLLSAYRICGWGIDLSG
jgi:hypothetical protein